MSKYIVTRSRVVNEAIAIDAVSTSDAITKSKKTKRKDWSHIESKKRTDYVASKKV